MTNKLMIFERKILRKIFDPTRTDDGYWRIKTNQEINDILKGQKEYSHSAHANVMNECLKMICIQVACVVCLFALMPLSVYTGS